MNSVSLFGHEMRPRLRHLVIAACVTLAGCGGSNHVASASDAAPKAAKAAEEARDDVRKAIEQLENGKPDAARKNLAAALKAYPDYAAATKLLRQIDADPHALLGSSSAPYTVRTGETFAIIAQRTVGDPMMFYALARYNGYAKPNDLAPGQSILIPRKERRADKHSEPGVRTAKAAAKEKRKVDKEAEKVVSAPVRAAAAAPPAPNPAAAALLRSQALVALNNGTVDRAVQLLREAAVKDPDNAVIKGDLARAERISKAVGNR